MPEVVLKIDDKNHSGWKSVRLSNSLDQLAASFSLTLTNSWSGRDEKYPIRLGSACALEIAGKTVFRGWVESLDISYDENRNQISASGRDLTGDLVDCSHVGERVDFANMDLLSIAKEVCEPFQVQVRAAEGVDLSSKLSQARYSQGDSVHDFLLRLAKPQAVLPVSFGDGVLWFTVAGATDSGGLLEQGRKSGYGCITKSGSARYSGHNRFAEYVVKGQGGPTKDYKMLVEDPEEKHKLMSPEGRAQDDVIKRHRPLVILAEVSGDPQSMETRACWESVFRAGKSCKVTYTVQGWGPTEDTIWLINQLVSVDDPLLGLKGKYLIEQVTLSLDESGGSKAELGVVHPDAYANKPGRTQAKNITNNLWFDIGT